MKTTLLKRTVPLFLKRGYRKLSMKDIAKHNNISVTTLYQFFKSKKKLIHHTLRVRKELFFTLNKHAEENGEHAIAHFYSLKNSIEQKVSVAQQRKNLLDLRKYYPNLFTKAKQDLDEFIGTCFQQIYERGVAEELFIKGVYDVVFCYAKQFYDYRLDETISEEKIEQLANLSEENFIRGLLTDKGRKAHQMEKKKQGL